MNSNIDDLDKLLDNDAAALLNMKKDITNAQDSELEKSRAKLAAAQKEYDVLKTSNIHKSKELADLTDAHSVLSGLIKSQVENSGKYMAQIDALNHDIAEVEDNYQAEMRTRKSLSFMTKRLEDEILDCKAASHSFTHALSQAKAEHIGVESTLRLSRHELTAEERILEQLAKTVKVRSEQRVEKMGELQSLVLDGEMSIDKVRHSLRGTLQVRFKEE